MQAGAQEDLSDTTCLVTGGTGLLGGHLIEGLIDRGARVVVLVRDIVPEAYVRGLTGWQRVIQVSGDLLDLPLLTRVLHDYDVARVFHLAAQTQVTVARRNPLDTFEINLRGVWLLMEAARSRAGATQVLLASTDKAYGPSEHLPYTEDHPHRPVHPYDTSKSCAESVARSYAATYEIPLLITRCANLYGPGDLNLDRLIPGTLRALLQDQRPIIRSDGSPQRDYLFVREAVGAMLAMTSGGVHWGGQAFNIGSGVPTSVIQAVEAVARAVGREDLAPLVLGEAPGEHQAQYLDSTRLRETVGWSSKVGLEEGLAMTVPWYRGWLAR